MMIDQFESGIALWNSQRRIGELEQESAANLQRALVAEKENTALRVSLEAAVLHAQKGWARSTQSTDQQNVSKNGGKIDVSTQEVG